MYRISFIFVLFITLFINPSITFAALKDRLPTSWNYKQIFLPSQIPVPDSAKDYGARIKAIYSPSVIKVDSKYYMFFGVSVFCAGDTVARDSIALAESTNGFDWNYKRYIIEPDPGMCWRKGGDYIFQLNDPSVYFDPDDPNVILVFYTTVRSTRDNFGNIGLAKFDRQLNQLYRNDLFLRGTTEITSGGFSRPAVNWLEPGGPRLYFDSSAKLGSVALTNLTELTNPVVRNENLVASDVHLPNLDKTESLLLSSAGIAFTRVSSQLTWSPGWNLTTLSGQEWDRNAQGSPEIFIDDGCKIRNYMAGIQMHPSGTDYEAINIGVAYPADDKSFSFDSCNFCTQPAAPVLTHPASNMTVRNGTSTVFTWTNSRTDNISAQHICVSSDQARCDLLWKKVDPTTKSVTITIPNADDLITWSVNNINTCGKQASAHGLFKSGLETLLGDLNGDSHVNLYDYTELVRGYGTLYNDDDFINVLANYGK